MEALAAHLRKCLRIDFQLTARQSKDKVSLEAHTCVGESFPAINRDVSLAAPDVSINYGRRRSGKPQNWHCAVGLVRAHFPPDAVPERLLCVARDEV